MYLADSVWIILKYVSVKILTINRLPCISTCLCFPFIWDQVTEVLCELTCVHNTELLFSVFAVLHKDVKHSGYFQPNRSSSEMSLIIPDCINLFEAVFTQVIFWCLDQRNKLGNFHQNIQDMISESEPLIEYNSKKRFAFPIYRSSSLNNWYSPCNTFFMSLWK